MGTKTKNKEWTERLEHMLGARSVSPGYRNRFCASIGSPDFSIMKELEAAGLVTPGQIINGGNMQYFNATRAGCEYIGMSEAGIKNALE